jgi:hypothetical protein
MTPVGRELPNRTAHMGMRMRAASADDDITNIVMSANRGGSDNSPWLRERLAQ